MWQTEAQVYQEAMSLEQDKAKAVSSDTAQWALDAQTEAYRRMSVAQKLTIAMNMRAFVRRVQLEAIKHDHPYADERELRLRLDSRWIEPALMKKFFDWDVEKEGY